MASIDENKPYLHPLNIISFLLDSGGCTTNTRLVQGFASYLQSQNEVAQINKTILKAVTGHVATLRRQGSRAGDTEDRTGKMIFLRNRFQGMSAGDVWSSLILSLSPEEISRLTPDWRVETEEPCHHIDLISEPKELFIRESSEHDKEILNEEKEDSSTEKHGTDNLKERDCFSDHDDVEYIKTSHYDIFNRRLDVEEKPLIKIETPDEDKPHIDQYGVEKFIKTRSVADLANSFNEIASTSSVSLGDHRRGRGDVGEGQRGNRVRLGEIF